MKTKHSIARWLMLLALSTFTTFYVAQPSTAFAQGTAFSYQGSLQNNGSPASGTYNLQFSLFNVNSGGSAVAGPVTTNGVIVTNGLFTVLIDFSPGAFTGMTCWLEMGVESNGVSSFTTLTPRQQLTPTPYAIFANTTSNLSGTLPAAQLSAGTANIGISGNAATATTANTFTSSLSGDVTGTQGATVVSTVGGQSAANVASGANAANAATSANTASTMVKRDGSGNFSAGIITASLSGNATSATTANNFSGSLAGNVTGTQGATVVSTGAGRQRRMSPAVLSRPTPPPAPIPPAPSSNATLLAAFRQETSRSTATLICRRLRPVPASFIPAASRCCTPMHL